MLYIHISFYTYIHVHVIGHTCTTSIHIDTYTLHVLLQSIVCHIIICIYYVLSYIHKVQSCYIILCHTSLFKLIYNVLYNYDTCNYIILKIELFMYQKNNHNFDRTQNNYYNFQHKF